MLIEFEAASERGPFTVAWRRFLRRAVLPYRWVGGALALLSVFTLAAEPHLAAAALAGGAVLCWFLAPAVMLHRAAGAAWEWGCVAARWNISDEGLRCESPEGQTLVRWSAVSVVEQVHDQLLIGLSGGRALVVPLAPLTPEQRQDVLAFLRARTLLIG
ncbi:YcxB family protein [Micromonospora chalcea]|uniref:YcxB family protein n=1 Tax=Micromonospora chalcea TaxID=1874 RepID=UPI0021A4ADD1|nr:YcxB family protein [Micromonospora chalcea]MCT2278546.1 YcxB family protein [Micromonospora chalcea]